MAVELAEVAAGLPVAASLALAGGITGFREGRRRSTLNEAIHELRRPLQVLSLSLPAEGPGTGPAESSLRLATVALDRLDREINRLPLEEVISEVSLAVLIDEAVRRWGAAASREGGSLEIAPHGEDTCVEGNRFDLAQALDNLLSNAIEHGGRQVRIGWRRHGAWVRVSVTDSGVPAGAGGKARRGLRRGDRCRGHGLRVVGRIARRHGGAFTLCRASGGAEASLWLPLRRRLEER
jgi:signal transduction histidine kinase